MNIVIFDTETTNLEKPFCYNIGYIIYNTEEKEIKLKREYIVEQIWHNLPLFATAYYAEKKQYYISAMKGRKAILNKYGYICQQMNRDFKNFEVCGGYAYNSNFDERVFSFNCDWFKCINPFDNIPIFDIRGYTHKFLANKDFKRFSELNSLFTDAGHYSTTAETMYKFIKNDVEFEEKHTALADSEIELEILLKCLEKGAELNTDYKAYKSIPRIVKKELHIKTVEQTDYYFEYEKIKINKDKTEIVLTEAKK